jgi:signal transduction histidine kinase
MALSSWMSYLVVAVPLLVVVPDSGAQPVVNPPDQSYEHKDTLELVALVKDAAEMVRTSGEASFGEFRVEGSRWRRGEMYVFVLDLEGNMLVHPDPAMQGKNELELKDIKGRPIIRGLIAAAAGLPGKPEGWHHYQWVVPGAIHPRWKSSYVRVATAPSGKRFVVGSGVYNDRMEKAFVVDAVKEAVAQIEKNGEAAFPLFHDPTGPFIVKDAYVFVIDPSGVELVNPAFPNLQGRNLLEVKDTEGKPLVRAMLDAVRTQGSGWVDYMWPKPGDSISTRKSTYVSKATVGEKWYVVGSGVYLADAPKATRAVRTTTAPELMALVREGAATFERQGEKAYPEFRKNGSRWFHDDLYFFVWTMDGMRTLNAADPSLEGRNGSDVKDVVGRPYGRMLLEAASGSAGEGWVHYMYPEPGDIFPAWKSVFVKRVTFPSGKQHLVAAGVYNMQMDKAFIQDVVDRAAALIATSGQEAFPQLRDKTGPFVFMDTYVFVDTVDGIEVVNAGQPSFEGTNLMGLKDLKGVPLADEYISAALRDGSAWVEYWWYKPGTNTPARKQAYVRKVKWGQHTYIVGSGFYMEH